MKKNALLSSILTIALCLSLIAGSTFALFTAEDEVNVAVTSGTVNVNAVILDDLQLFSLGVEQANNTFANKGTAFFTEGKTNKELNLSNMTPGDEARFTIQVTNNSNVTIQYRVKWIVDGELYDALTATVDGEALVNNTTEWAEWEIPANAAETVKTFEVSVLLPTSVGNEFQNKNASIQFVVEAVQGNAVFEEITTVEQLTAALEMGTNIKLGADVKMDANSTITVAENANMVIDLAGHTLTAENTKDAGAVIVNNGTLNIIGSGKITNETVNGGAIVQNNGTMTISGVELVGAPMDSTGYPAYTVLTSGKLTVEAGTTVTSNRGAISMSNGANVEINGGDFVVSNAADGRNMTLHTIYAYGYNSTLTINGGNFEMGHTSTGGASVICPAGATITINDGNFRDPHDDSNWTNTGNFQLYMNYGAPIYVYGGTFNDKSVMNKQITLGSLYQVEYDAATGIYSVVYADDVTVADDQNSFADAVANAASGDKNIVLTAGTYEFPAGMNTDGLTIIGEEGVVFEDTLSGSLNNLTLKNVHIKAGNAQRWAYSNGDLLFENCTFEATSIYAIHYDGLNNANITYKNCTIIGWAAIGSGANHVTFDGCEIYGNGTYGVIRLYSPGTIKNCTFDVKDVNETDVYQDGIHAVDCTLNLSNNVNANGEMEEIYNLSGDAIVNVDGVNYVASAASLESLLTANEEVINVKLANNIEANLSEKLGGADTKEITIDLGGNKLTQTDSYRALLGATNADATLTIKNGSMDGTRATGTWDVYDLLFNNCNLVIENVVFEKSVALEAAGKNATLTNVTINEDHDYYALWITAEAQSVTIDGLTINSLGRGIKIDEQYVGAENLGKVTLNISNTTFNTANKSAIIVKSAVGADINLNNVDIANVAQDWTNAVWVDEDAADYANLVTVTGGTAIVEP